MEDLSLFEGDLLNRLFSRLGIRSHGGLHLVARCLVVIVVTFVPTAVLALVQGYGPGRPRTLNMFGDIAALGMAFLGYPLFIVAEWIIGEKTLSAGRHFRNSGVILPEAMEFLDGLHRRISRLRRWWVPETVCLLIAYVFSFWWLYEETHNAYDTWHAVGAPGVQRPTLAGWWLTLVGIPIFNFWWLRWIWKISLWCWYLYRISRQRLRLIASHPDRTGGLGFISEAQASFAIVIFAFGVGIIAPLVGYKLEIEKASLVSFSVGGPLLGFIIGAPAFFTLPLLMFTKQLYRSKRRAMDAYHERATEAALEFEEKWLSGCSGPDCEVLFGSYLTGMNSLHTAFRHIEEMRMVPFDLRSFGQLLGSAFGSLLPIASKLLELPEPTDKLLDILKSLLGGGHG